MYSMGDKSLSGVNNQGFVNPMYIYCISFLCMHVCTYRHDYLHVNATFCHNYDHGCLRVFFLLLFFMQRSYYWSEYDFQQSVIQYSEAYVVLACILFAFVRPFFVCFFLFMSVILFCGLGKEFGLHYYSGFFTGIAICILGGVYFKVCFWLYFINSGFLLVQPCILGGVLL